MSKRVFVVEKPKGNINLADAERFGSVVTLFPPSERRAPVFKTMEYVRDVLSALERHKFDPYVDLFCVAGTTLGVTLAVTGIVSRYGRINMLGYSAGECRYVELTEVCQSGIVSMQTKGDTHHGQGTHAEVA